MSRSHAMRAAGERELGAVWAAVRASHLFATREDFEAVWRDAPWRVQASEAGDAALVGVWRSHSGLLAIQGLWCAERNMTPLLRDLASLARCQGFSGLLSPLVVESLSAPYVLAGMKVVHRGITLRLDRPCDQEPTAIPGIGLRLAGPADIEALERVDSACFDDFWRFDTPTLRRYVASERATVAVRGDLVIGYTLCTVRRGEGMLGRLAVVPEERARGIGALLLSDAVAFMARSDARAVTLYTQEENVSSRALYARGGFWELPGASCFLTMDVD